MFRVSSHSQSCSFPFFFSICMRGLAKVKMVACLDVHADSRLKFRKRLSQKQYPIGREEARPIKVIIWQWVTGPVPFQMCFDITHSLLKGQSLQHAIHSTTLFRLLKTRPMDTTDQRAKKIIRNVCFTSDLKCSTWGAISESNSSMESLPQSQFAFIFGCRENFI